MNFLRQLALYETRGFTKDQATTIVLMKQAALALFEAFPDTFLIIGGATLLLFHDSPRLSADLDLITRTNNLPPAEAITATLEASLRGAALALATGDVRIRAEATGTPEIRVRVENSEGRSLFRVDLNRFGSVLDSEIEEHVVDDTDVTLKSASKNFLLLQKAEAFLLRKVFKARDAYDIYLLMGRGAGLSETLRAHLSDTLQGCEIEAEQIRSRVNMIDERRCRGELRAILPASAFNELEQNGFDSLRKGVEALYEPWLAQ